MTNYARHKHHLHWLDVHYLTKVSPEISASSLKDFLNKGRTRQEYNGPQVLKSFQKFEQIL